MRIHACVLLASIGACASASSLAMAGFDGQTILGPLTAGSTVLGNTAGQSDDNDGFDSGTHIFNVWDGGDDVYALNWGGGDLTVTLSNLDPFSDNDLFLYSPSSLDSTGDYSVLGSADTDVVTILGARAGTYYINVDSTAFSEGAYQLSVPVPAPASCVLLAAGMLGFGRRRRN